MRRASLALFYRWETGSIESWVVQGREPRSAQEVSAVELCSFNDPTTLSCLFSHLVQVRSVLGTLGPGAQAWNRHTGHLQTFSEITWEPSCFSLLLLWVGERECGRKYSGLASSGHGWLPEPEPCRNGAFWKKNHVAEVASPSLLGESKQKESSRRHPDWKLHSLSIHPHTYPFLFFQPPIHLPTHPSYIRPSTPPFTHPPTHSPTHVSDHPASQPGSPLSSVHLFVQQALS